MKNIATSMMIGLIISFAMVQISPYPVQAKKTSAKDNLAITFFDGSKTHHIVYTKSGELKVKKIDGLVYNKNTKTLQISNLKKGALDIHHLHSKLTIDVIGSNRLSYIHMDEPVENPRILFAGKGKLILNRERDNVVPMLLDLNGKSGGIVIEKDLRLISYKSSGAPDEFSDLNKNIYIRNSGDKKSYLTNKHNKKTCTSDKKTVFPNTRKVYLMNERGQYEEEPILVQEYTYFGKTIYVEKIYKDGGEPQKPQYRCIELDQEEQKNGQHNSYGHVVTMSDFDTSALKENYHSGKMYECYLSEDVIRMK